MNGINLIKKNNSRFILTIVLVLYVISAIAYECTPETAQISTLAIYLWFIIGGFYILKEKILCFNIYTTSVIIFAIYVFVMYIPMQLTANPSVSESSYSVVYANLTCMILCVIMYMVIYHNPDMVKWIILANIVGAIILAIRVVNFYGDVATMIEYASDVHTREHRIGKEIINANLLGLYMGNALLCTVTTMLTVKKHKLCFRCALFLLGLAFVGVAFLTGSKKAIAFVLMGIISMVIFISKGHSGVKKLLILMVGFLVVVFAVWSISYFEFFATIRLRFDALIMNFTGEKLSQTDQNRTMYVVEGMEAFYRSPIWGNGTGYSYKLFGTYAHNNFVELLMNYGVIGFLLHYIPIASLILKTYRNVKYKDVYSIYFLVYIIVLVIMGIGLVSYYDRVMQLIIAGAHGYCDRRKEVILNENKECI